MPLIRKTNLLIAGKHTVCSLKYHVGKGFIVELPEPVVVLSGDRYEHLPTEIAADNRASTLVEAYNVAITTEEKVICYEFIDARDREEHHGGNRVFWFGMKLRWRITTRFKIGDKYEYVDGRGHRANVYGESAMLWTPEREDFIKTICAKLGDMADGTEAFFNEDGCAERIDAMIPRLTGGAGLHLLLAPPEQ